jgi:MFS family permease
VSVGRGGGARFGDVFRLQEFRALYIARLLSLSGDQIAKVALGIAVYRRSHSALLTAATFAAAFLPWIVSGPFLSVLADRYRRRDVMVVCDVVRAVLVSLLALPGLPLPVLFALLVAVVVMAAPFEAARAALIPEVLAGDDYVVGSSLGQAATQGAQVLGYLIGGAAVALLTPSGALLTDAATFVASACLVLRVRRGQLPTSPEGPPALITDLRLGAKIVFESDVLRTMVTVAWVTSVFLIVPEGLAIACANEVGGGSVIAAVLTAAVPGGAVVGALAIARYVSPERRLRLIPPLAILTAAPLVLSLLGPWTALLAVAWVVAGLGAALHVPAIATFVTHTPAHLRGRAFGLAESGLQAVQGIALLVAGALATVWSPRIVVGVAGIAGVLSVVVLLARWPASVRAMCRGVAGAAGGDGVPDEVDITCAGDPVAEIAR